MSFTYELSCISLELWPFVSVTDFCFSLAILRQVLVESFITNHLLI